MPNLKGYGRKRKFLKRRRFVPRASRKGLDLGGSSNNPSVGFSRLITAKIPFAASMRCRMVFSEPSTLTTGLSVYGAEIRYRLNSVYDPRYAVGGNTVRNYNVYSGIYQQYRVDKCHYQIIFTTPGAGNDIMCACTVAPNTSGSVAGATIGFPAEFSGGKYGVLSSAGERRCILQGTIDLAAINGVSHTRYNSDDAYSSYIGASPVQEALLSAAICCADGTTGVNCAALVVLTYDVVWFNRIIN